MNNAAVLTWRTPCPAAYQGCTAVEFAVVLPVLLLLICAIMDLGNLYYQKHTVSKADYLVTTLFRKPNKKFIR